jgi:uncharacterized peroxidase-related enzyme
MPYITLEESLPGVTGLLEYRQDTGSPIRELTQILLRGHSSLTEAEREMIAMIVSSRNECKFCTAAHTATIDILLGENRTAARIKQDLTTAPISDKMKTLLIIASQVQMGGKFVTPEAIKKAKDNGATDIEIHDTVLIAALFCLYNRYVDGLSTLAPDDPEFYKTLGERLTKQGYNRPAHGYDLLGKNYSQPI